MKRSGGHDLVILGEKIVNVLPDSETTYLLKEEHWHTGPTFDLHLEFPAEITRKMIYDTYLTFPDTFPWSFEQGHLASSDLGYSIYYEPDRFQHAIGFGHSSIIRTEKKSHRYSIFIYPPQMERLCETDCSDPDRVGDIRNLRKLYEVLIKQARFIADKLPVRYSVIAGEIWPWPEVQSMPGEIAIHSTIARTFGWQGNVRGDWIGLSLRV